MPEHCEIPIRCYGVSAVILRREKTTTKMLLLRRAPASNGQWCQIAGGIERNETAWQAALREIKEEANLIPDLFYSADICEQFYEVDKDAIWIAPVFVGFVSAEQNVTLNDEHTDFQWVTIEDAQRIVPFSGQRRVYEHIKREFIDRAPNELLLIRTNDT